MKVNMKFAINYHLVRAEKTDFYMIFGLIYEKTVLSRLRLVEI